MITPENLTQEYDRATGGKPAVVEKSARVFDRLRQGKFFTALYDSEVSSLDKRAAEMTQFGGLVKDIAGNPLYGVDLRGKPSGFAVFDPIAWTVQRMRAEDLDKGDPQYILFGKIMQFFRHAGNLHEAPFATDFVKKYCRPTEISNAQGEPETVYAYPLANADGTQDWDCLYFHGNLMRYSYRDPKAGDRWITKKIGAFTKGYNNVNADDQWIWSGAHAALAENIFITHLPTLGKLREDMLRTVEVAVMADSKNDNSLKPGTYTHPVTKETHMSFRQGAILEANTRLDSEFRGIDEGIRLLDGSYPDLSQLHGAFGDVIALDGIERYLLKHNPAAVHEAERNGNWKDVVERLTANPDGFGNHPLLGYVDKSYPKISGHIVCLIGTDQYRHNPKMALMLNLNVDLDTYTFNGKTLEEMTPPEHAKLIKHCRATAGGPYKVIYTHKSPRLFSKEMAFDAGFNKGIDENTLMKRADLSRKQSFVDAAMEGFRIAHPRLHGPDRLILPQPEEELFSFHTLEMYDPEAGEDVQIHRPRNRLEKEAQDSRYNIIATKKLWLRAMEPDDDFLLNTADDFRHDEDLKITCIKKLWKVDLSPDEKQMLKDADISKKEDIKDTFRAAYDFVENIREINKKLKDLGAPLLPPPNENDLPCDSESALRYKIKIMFFARQNFLDGLLQDITHAYWFEDESGQEVPMEELLKWEEWRLDEAFTGGRLSVQHETINTTPQLIDRVLTQLGFGDVLGPEAQKVVEASRRLHLHGIPQMGSDRQRWTTIHSAWHILQKLRKNELTDEDVIAIEGRKPGAWQRFMTENADTEAALNEYEVYLQNLMKTPFTPEDKLLVGVDPATGHHIEKVKNDVDPKNIVRLRVPDRYLEDPAIDPKTNRPVWLIPLTGSFNKAACRNLQRESEIVLEAAGSGKTLHLAKAYNIHTPAHGGINKRLYDHAAARFNDSGQKLPEVKGILVFTGENPVPLHGLRPIDKTAQTLHVPQDHFEGLMDYRLANYPAKVTGMIFRDDKLKLHEGTVRLLELGKNGEPTGWSTATTVERVQRLSMKDISVMDNKQAQKYGYPTALAMVDAVAQMFSNHKMDPRDKNNTVWVADFGAIKPHNARTGTAYYNPQAPKISAVRGGFG